MPVGEVHLTPLGLGHHQRLLGGELALLELDLAQPFGERVVIEGADPVDDVGEHDVHLIEHVFDTQPIGRETSGAGQPSTRVRKVGRGTMP